MNQWRKILRKFWRKLRGLPVTDKKTPEDIRAFKLYQREIGNIICQSKKYYETRTQAWRFCVNWNQIRAMKLSPYKCRYCPYYHLTSKHKNPQTPKRYARII